MLHRNGNIYEGEWVDHMYKPGALFTVTYGGATRCIRMMTSSSAEDEVALAKTTNMMFPGTSRNVF